MTTYGGVTLIDHLAYNLATSMQYSIKFAQKLKPNKKFARLHKVMEWRIFWFFILNHAGEMGRENGCMVFQETRNPETQSVYEKISKSLEEIKVKKTA